MGSEIDALVEAKKALAAALADEKRCIKKRDAERALVARWEEHRQTAQRRGQAAETRNALALRCEHEAYAKAAEDACIRQRTVLSAQSAALDAALSRLEASKRKLAVAAARKAGVAGKKGFANARARFDRALTRARSIEASAAGSADELWTALTTLVLAMNNALVEAKKHLASMIADEKRLAAQAVAARAHETEWRKRAAKGRARGVEGLEREAEVHARDHRDTREGLLAEWRIQKTVVDELKTALRDMIDGIEGARLDAVVLVGERTCAEALEVIRRATAALTWPASRVLRRELEAMTSALASAVARATDYQQRERELSTRSNGNDAPAWPSRRKTNRLRAARWRDGVNTKRAVRSIAGSSSRGLNAGIRSSPRSRRCRPA